MKKILSISLFFSLCLFVSYSCHDNRRQQELINREQALELREDSFAQKEAEYQTLLKMRDSLIAVKDSIKLLTAKSWPDSIAGKWNSKLICTESNCNDYVIGDQRTYTWEFGNDSLRLITKVLNNKDKLVREYDSEYSENKISLFFKTDSTASKPVTMHVNLNKIGKNTIKGIHTINIDNNCTAKFSVELTRPKPDK